MTRKIDPALIQFLPASVVQAELDSRKAQITKVTFVKKDGTMTTRVGLPRVHKRRVGGEKGRIAAQALKDNGNVFFDYTDPDAPKNGFAFNLGRVVAIGDSGVHPTA